MLLTLGVQGADATCDEGIEEGGRVRGGREERVRGLEGGKEGLTRGGREGKRKGESKKGREGG